ncbi:hypothetical protein H0H87_002246 [Tephrocybe sp. NHM501043]|nr:hypothetical protein H0H87_002246 [Tephrocybe sp. NHM501043]
MKTFGSTPLESLAEVGGVVRCGECTRPVLRSAFGAHVGACHPRRLSIRPVDDVYVPQKLARQQKPKRLRQKVIEPPLDAYTSSVPNPPSSPGKSNTSSASSKKRKASREPSPNPGDAATLDGSQPPKKKPKATPKVTKGRTKGPVDYDRQCGVINDKNLPCSRSLTCKSHSMGAKRAVQGRTRPYDELLLDWQRANNPNFVEPVKRETKAEKKEKREREKMERRRLLDEEARARGEDPEKAAHNQPGGAGGAGSGGKKAAAGGAGGAGGGKKSKKAAAAAVRLAEEMGEEAAEDLSLIDSETELDGLVRAVRGAEAKGTVGVPLAVACDAGSWFVQRRERARCCRDLLIGALGSGGGAMAGGMAGVGLGLGMNMNMGIGAMSMNMGMGISMGVNRTLSAHNGIAVRH